MRTQADRLKIRGKPFSENAYTAAQQQHADRSQNLAEVDIVAGDLIVEAEHEHIAQQISANQRERGQVSPDNNNINEHKEPRAEKAVVIAQDFFLSMYMYLRHRDSVSSKSSSSFR